MRDKHLNSDYVEYLRQASKWHEQHNNAYSNLCSEIALPGTYETAIERTVKEEPDNSVLLLM